MRPFRRMEWEVVREPIRARYRPTPEILAECRQAGRVAGRACRGRLEAVATRVMWHSRPRLCVVAPLRVLLGSYHPNRRLSGRFFQSLRRRIGG